MHFGVIEIVVIALLVFLLFGYKKLPTAMKSLKDSLEIFKKEKKNDPAASESVSESK